MGSRDRMAIVTTHLKLITDFTDDKKLLRSTLDSIKKEQRHGRYDYSSLMAVLNELFTPSNRRPVVVLQSFGEEVYAMKPMWKGAAYEVMCRRGMPGTCERDFGFSEVLDIIERSPRHDLHRCAGTPGGRTSLWTSRSHGLRST